MPVQSILPAGYETQEQAPNEEKVILDGLEFNVDSDSTRDLAELGILDPNSQVYIRPALPTQMHEDMVAFSDQLSETINSARFPISVVSQANVLMAGGLDTSRGGLAETIKSWGFRHLDLKAIEKVAPDSELINHDALMVTFRKIKSAPIQDEETQTHEDSQPETSHNSYENLYYLAKGGFVVNRTDFDTQNGNKTSARTPQTQIMSLMTA